MGCDEVGLKLEPLVRLPVISDVGELKIYSFGEDALLRRAGRALQANLVKVCAEAQLIGFENSRGSLVLVEGCAFVDRSGARGKLLRDEFDRVDVSAAVVQGAAELMVESVDVAVAEAAGSSDLVAEVGGHLVHEAEDAAACRLGETNPLRIDLGEGIGRQGLCVKFRLDGVDQVGADRAQVGASYPGPEHREQRSASARRAFCSSAAARADDLSVRQTLACGPVRHLPSLARPDINRTLGGVTDEIACGERKPPDFQALSP